MRGKSRSGRDRTGPKRQPGSTVVNLSRPFFLFSFCLVLFLTFSKQSVGKFVHNFEGLARLSGEPGRLSLAATAKPSQQGGVVGLNYGQYKELEIFAQALINHERAVRRAPAGSDVLRRMTGQLCWGGLVKME